MQTIYSWFQDKEVSEKDVAKRYHQHVRTSYELLIFNIRNLVQVARMSVDDKARRNEKYLPTEMDRLFQPVLFQNPVMDALENCKELKKYNKDYFNDFLDVMQARNLYREFAKTKPYLHYLDVKHPTVEDHTNILLELWNFLYHEPLYIELVYDAYPSWIDDDSLVKGFVKRLIKGISEDETLLAQYKPDREAVFEFGECLLEDVIQRFDEYDGKLIPYLQGWEIDRIAIMDRILIKMALSEFLHFPSIPTKVTLNEYVDIGKMYSTEKSKEFLNGILDALLKDLTAADEVQKSGRGLIQ